ncbi:MAG: pseudouridine synthase [Bacteroidetes bacterium]|nr:pseudouridine synthase [Bacteroidota bacterium]
MDYFLIYKPFGVHSQFKPDGEKPGLGTLHDFPKDVYPVGRLDADSEGLLLLTNDTAINKRLLHPRFKHHRTYLIQVEGTITQEAIDKLCDGVSISIDGREHFTAPAKAKIIPPPELPERNPPIRFRKTVPDSWLELTITEGKNRQVRKMTAAVGFPTLRLVRWKIEDLTMENPEPGMVVELDRDMVFKKLKL